MGYANTVPFSMVQLSGQTATTYTITNVASDKDFPTITLPDYKNPLAYAYVDFIIQWARNNLAGFNKITAGSFGLKDNGGIFRESGQFHDGFCPMDAGIDRYQQLQINGYTNIATYLNAGDTVTPGFDGVTSNGDNMQWKDMIPIIRLYFEA